MNFDPNDTKWTAYLLNELGEAERKAVEAELELSTFLPRESGELRIEVKMSKFPPHSPC